MYTANMNNIMPRKAQSIAANLRCFRGRSVCSSELSVEEPIIVCVELVCNGIACDLLEYNGLLRNGFVRNGGAIVEDLC